MQILYITGGFPYPLTSGFLRHYHFIRELSAQHDITLLSLAGPQYQPEHGQAMRPFLRDLHVFPTKSHKSTWRRRWNHGRRMLLGRDAAIDRMRETVRQLRASTRFDAVIQSSKTTTPVLKDLNQLPVLVDLCDAASQRVRGRIRHTAGRQRAWLWLEYLMTRQAERSYLLRATHMTFASCRDREALVPDKVDRASVIPNGVDVDFWRRNHRLRPNHSLVFTGAMHYAPNVDAAVFLARQIMPRVLKACPDASLQLVGRDPRPEVQALAKLPGVTVTGYVDDVRPYLENATLFVAPLRFGTGIQNKVLEAMSMEVPTIVSPLAADGLRTESGALPPIEMANTADEFAQAILRGFQRQPLDPTPDAAARAFVQEHFHWSTSGHRVHDLLCAIAAPSSSERPVRESRMRTETLATALNSARSSAAIGMHLDRLVEKKVS